MRFMHRRMALVVVLLALAGAALLAADNAAVGTWQLTSDSPGGEQYAWTLVIKGENGKLSGTLSGGPGQFPLLDPKMEGEAFTCKITIDETTYAIQAKISGNKFDGTWKGPASQGMIKGTKQA
jgi:hypothetical protein